MIVLDWTARYNSGMLRCRFLQLSDLHFGAPMTGSKLDLPPEKQAQRQQEFGNLVRSLPGIVKEHRLDAVLIPGDLWDNECLDSSQLSRFRILYQALCELSPTPVIIAPGNHDFYSPNSFYHPETLRGYQFDPWPEHIRIFTEPEFQTAWLPGWEERVRLTGRAFHDNTLNMLDNHHRQERPLRSLPPREPSEVMEILLFHGARDDFNRFEDKITAPFSQAELLALNLDYVAVGHYHRRDVFTNAAGEIKGAYSGCPFGRGLDETEKKCALIVELTKDGLQPAHVSLEDLSLDPRKVVFRELLIYGENLEALYEQVLADLRFHAEPQDMIYCELKGQVAPGLPLHWHEQLESRLMTEGGFFHVKLEPRQVSLMYDIERLREDTYSLEGRFIRAIELRMENAPDEQRAILEKALYLGLDAMIRQEVRQP